MNFLIICEGVESAFTLKIDYTDYTPIILNLLISKNELIECIFLNNNFRQKYIFTFFIKNQKKIFFLLRDIENNINAKVKKKKKN